MVGMLMRYENCIRLEISSVNHRRRILSPGSQESRPVKPGIGQNAETLILDLDASMGVQGQGEVALHRFSFPLLWLGRRLVVLNDKGQPALAAFDGIRGERNFPYVHAVSAGAVKLPAVLVTDERIPFKDNIAALMRTDGGKRTPALVVSAKKVSLAVHNDFCRQAWIFFHFAEIDFTHG
jgi:hypothetical protein